MTERQASCATRFSYQLKYKNDELPAAFWCVKSTMTLKTTDQLTKSL